MLNKDALVNLEHVCKAGREAILPHIFSQKGQSQVKKEIKTFCGLSLILSFLLYSPTISFAAIDHLGDYDNRANEDTNGNGGVFSLSNAIYNSIRGNYTNNTATNAGGALYLTGTSRINIIDGDFSGNKITTNGGIGGAIFNNAYIGNIYGSFSSNTINTLNVALNASGGAIYNTGYIGGIYADFTKNIVGIDGNDAYNREARGGAIYNADYIGTISGIFESNTAFGSEYNTGGGAIYNDNATIDNILGTFNKNIGGISTTTSASIDIGSGGGAIHNYMGIINNINANFTFNEATNSLTGGGAIFNNGASLTETAFIGSIQGTFTSNKGVNWGGAIYNSEFGIINYINATFKDNYLYGSSNTQGGGAIANNGTIGSIMGLFEKNVLYRASNASNYAYGAAIANMKTGSINTIIADFIGNGSTPNSTLNVYLYGGAIYNHTTARIGTISSNFESNYATANVNTAVAGGAIYNTGAISNFINSSFTGNTVTSSYNSNTASYGGTAKGGAIVNTGADAKIGTIEASFSNNKAQVLSDTTDTTGNTAVAGSAQGGAIYNDDSASIDSIVNSSFNNNSVIVGSTTSDSNSHARGGAIYNGSTASIGSILNSTFSYNSVKAGSGDSSRAIEALGGAIYNSGSITGSIVGNFIENNVKTTSTSATNYVSALGGAIYNVSNASISGDIKGVFDGNSVSGNTSNIALGGSTSAYLLLHRSGGGAIANNGTIDGTIQGTFSNNEAIGGTTSYSTTYYYLSGGGAIYNYTSCSIGGIIANFINNSTNQRGGAIFNAGTITNGIAGNFTDNHADVYGGAIYNTNANINTISGNFIRNTAGTYGGAIYTSSNMTLGAHNATYEFTNNRANSSYNAIHVTGTGSTALTFKMTGTGGFIMNDSITGGMTEQNTSSTATTFYTLALNGDDKADNTFALNAAVSGANTVNITDATLSLGSFLHDNNTPTTGSVNASSISFTRADLALDLSAHTGTAFLTATNNAGSGNINVGASSTLTLNRVTASASPILIASDQTDTTNTFWTTNEQIVTTSLVNASIYDDITVTNYKNYNFAVKLEVNTDHEIFDTEFSKMSLASVDGTIKNGATLDYMQGLTNENISISEQKRLMQGGTRISSLAGTATNAKTAMTTSNNIVSARFDTADSYSLAQHGKITQVASNGLIIQEKTNNVSVWGMPMFAYETISNIAAGDFTNNYTTNIYGITAGFDAGFNLPYFDMTKLGLAVNLGTGDTNTYGDYSTIANDFTFYGFTGYGAMQKDKLRVHLNLGYSKTSSDLAYGIDVDSYSPKGVKAEVANNVLHLGTKAEYALYNKNNVELTPYAGLEVLNINTKDYALKEDNAASATIFNMQVENQTVLQVPLGAKASKTQVSRSDWFCLSQARLGAILSAGNLNENSYAYAPNASVNINHITKNFDIITADAGLAFKAQKNHWQIGIEASSQLSANRMAFAGALEAEYSF